MTAINAYATAYDLWVKPAQTTAALTSVRLGQNSSDHDIAKAHGILEPVYGEDTDSPAALKRALQNENYQLHLINGREVFSGFNLPTGFQIDYATLIENSADANGKVDTARVERGVSSATLALQSLNPPPNFVFVEVDESTRSIYEGLGFQQIAAPGTPNGYTMMVRPMNDDAAKVLGNTESRSKLWVDHVQNWYDANYQGLSDPGNFNQKHDTLSEMRLAAAANKPIWIQKLPLDVPPSASAPINRFEDTFSP